MSVLLEIHTHGQLAAPLGSWSITIKNQSRGYLISAMHLFILHSPKSRESISQILNLLLFHILIVLLSSCCELKYLDLTNLVVC